MFKKLLKDKRNAQNAILDAAIAENRGMTPEEQEKYNAMEVECKNLEVSIIAQDEKETREAAEAAEEEAAKTSTDTLALPNEGNTVPAEAKRSTNIVDITRKICGSVGKYFQAVHKSKTDPEAVTTLAKLNQETIKFVNAASGMSESVPADGGVLVGTDVSSALLDMSIEQSKLLQRIFKLPISQNSNAITLPTVDDTNLAMYWDGEADLMAGVKPSLDTVDLKLKNLNGLIYVTNDLLDDAASLEAYIMKKFPEVQSKKLDRAILTGTGAGMPLGINNCPALITVPKETGQATKTIVPQNIVRMYARFDGNENTAVWVANRDILPQLALMSMVFGAGGQMVYMPPQGLAGAMNGTLLGIPVILIEDCKTLGTKGDIMLIDMAQYIMADKGAMKVAASMHVRFEYNEMAYRFTYRVDGQPGIKKARTPAESPDTVSPFITLATR